MKKARMLEGEKQGKQDFSKTETVKTTTKRNIGSCYGVKGNVISHQAELNSREIMK